MGQFSNKYKKNLERFGKIERKLNFCNFAKVPKKRAVFGLRKMSHQQQPSKAF